MSKDFIVEIEYVTGDELYFFLLPPGKTREQLKTRRKFSAKDAAALQSLLSGLAESKVVDNFASEISNWLLGSDLYSHLLHALKNGEAAAGEPVRLVIDANRKISPEIAGLPIELISIPYTPFTPFVLTPEVESIIHLIRRNAAPQPSLSTPQRPLKILLVRTSPTDENVDVPKAKPLAEAINAAVPAKLKGHVAVEVLSSEDEGSPPVTWQAFRDKVKGPPYYDILVYLGHGDLTEGEGGYQAGALLFETPGTGSDPVGHSDHVDASRLRLALLGRNSPPVVLLCGCLTAAEAAAPPAAPEDDFERVSRQMRGMQGVAQSLVGDLGVQLAVGMRYRLEIRDATKFIEAFFESLFGEERPGNVEAAVRAARLKLSAGGLYPPNWSAPAIYRATGAEPTFPLIVNLLNEPDPPPAPAADPLDSLREERDLARRSEAWIALAQYPGLPLALDLLGELDAKLRDRMLERGALLKPARVVAKPESAATIPVGLSGPLSIRSLQVQLILGGSDARFDGVGGSAALEAGGFELKNVAGVGTTSLTFDIEAPAEARLPEGELFGARVTTGKSFAVVHPVSVCVLGKSPAGAPVQALGDALIVPAPIGEA